jgi:hypothetical protein
MRTTSGSRSEVSGQLVSTHFHERHGMPCLALAEGVQSPHQPAIWTFSEFSSSAMAEAPIEILQYDSSWPSRFERERALLEPILPPWLAGPIEHIGSTAIPGMVAKPVIDIMAAVESLDASRGAISAATNAGYLYFPYRPKLMHWFCKPSPAFERIICIWCRFPASSGRNAWCSGIGFEATLSWRPSAEKRFGRKV